MSIRKRYKNKKAFYEVQLYVRGLRLAYKCFDSRAEAHKWHEEHKEKWKAHPLSLKKENSNRSFMDVLDLYKKQKFPLLALSTQQSIEGRYIYLLESPFVQVRMSKLSAEHIDFWLDWLKEHPKVDHGKRKNFVQELKILGHVLHWYHHFIDPSFVVPIVKRHKLKCFYKQV